MIIWEGKSRIDGASIVVIATIHSTNSKTGDAVQTTIIRSDVNPVTTRYTGEDYSVCGDCVHRHFKDGDCYVQLYQGPRAVFEKYSRGGYNCPKHIAEVEYELTHKHIRLGAYGDPCAVPYEVWESLIAQGTRSWSGFTHQWRNPENQEYRKLLMASCDSAQDVLDAEALGWRSYRVKYDHADDHLLAHLPVVTCLYDTQGLKCVDCGICDGTRAEDRTRRAHVQNMAHGARSMPKLKAAQLRLTVMQ